MKTICTLTSLAVCVCQPVWAEMPLTESVFTEIIREANVVAAINKSSVPAVTNTVFHAPDLVRTGPASRVEMTAPDQTITRVGANTVFTFAPGGRNILLEKGSILFHPPAGVGGGTVTYRGTAAAVLGTTMICAVLPDGSFKILDLEGHVKVTLKQGAFVLLEAGQMVIVPPDGNEFGDVLVFNLAELVPRLLLVVGFSVPLSSQPFIATAIQLQSDQIVAGLLPNLASFLQVALGLETILDRNLPPWMLNAPDHTENYISPVRAFPYQTWPDTSGDVLN
jgi:FecR protein